jgi:hypothetical protein
MIFKPRLVRLILAGKKTQTRRPRRGEEECRYQVGRSYAVQPGRGMESVGRILITDVREELLHELTQPDAIREGFRTTEEFFDYWRELYREGPVGLKVPVWVISFDLDRSHQPRLLHRQSERGYTINRHDALEDRWTHWWKGGNSVAQLDHVLLSPGLSRATAGAIPHIERRGIGFSRRLERGGFGPRETRFKRREDDPSPVPLDFGFPRFEGVSDEVYASDHCGVFIDLP